jgi:hypothetical protein
LIEDPRAVPLITFDEAQRIGGELHDHWQRQSGKPPPLARHDFAWGDMVQFVLRKAHEAVQARESEGES